MSKIFISHSSADNAAALALAQWLAASGWADYFLDLSPSRGLAPGEKWQEALKAAADRCEAVICLISPAWRSSDWCDREFYVAKLLGKRIFAVLIEPTPLDDLPRDMMSEWQLCDLVLGEARETLRVAQDPLVPETDVSFAADGLSRLRHGLQKAGLDPGTFPWPPKYDPERAPYRGLRALEPEDAAVFFGREACIVRALNELRKRRDRGTERLFVILGASGSGKSSFLRAGLWPRLARDDWNFLPLPVLRPERAPLSGVSGLAACVESAFRERKSPKTRASITQLLQREDGLIALLTELQHLAIAPADTRGESTLPTVVISIDQGEELFVSDGRHEAELVLSAVASALNQATHAEGSGAPMRPPIVIIAIRSDSYELLQTEKRLSGLNTCLFDLPPLPATEYKAVVEGPAMRATDAGHRLDIDPLLTEKLIDDTEGADALPLLAFTLERLYLQYGSVGRLQLLDYEALGGVRGSIEAAVQAAFEEPSREPVIPAAAEHQDRLLHAAFVPWLARVDPETEKRKRRVARWDELPREALPLLERLIEKRLLVKRGPTEESPDDMVLVEVAHEALLRQWPTLTEWLSEDAQALKRLEVVEKAVAEWVKNRDKEGGGEAWLVHTGERLAAAEVLRRRPDFERQLGDDGRAYLDACRARDERVRAEREAYIAQIEAERDRAEKQRERAENEAANAKREAERAENEAANAKREAERAENEAANARREADAAERSRRRATSRTRLAIGALLMVVVTSALMGLFYKLARDRQEEVLVKGEQARLSEQKALSSSLASESQYYVGKRPDQSLLLALAALKVEPIVEARSALLYSLLDNPKLQTLLHDAGPVNAVAVSPNGVLIATAGEDGRVTLWNVAGARRDGAPLEHTSAVTAVAFDSDGRRIATATSKGEVLLWDVATRKRVVESVRKHDRSANGLAFSPDRKLLASAGADRTIRLWDAATGEMAGAPLARYNDEVTSVAFSPDGRTLGSGSADGQVILWDLATRQASPLKEVHTRGVTNVAFDPTGGQLASGSRDGTIALWHVAGRRLRARLVSEREQEVTSVAFSPDGARLFAGGEDGTIEVWDVSGNDQPTAVTMLTGHRERVSGVAFGPTKDLLVSSSLDGTTALWNLERANRIAEPFERQSGAVNAVAFGGIQDQMLAAAGGGDGTILLYDVATRKVMPPLLAGSEGEVKALAFSRDGKLLASGSIHGQVTLWDPAVAKRVSEPLPVHKGAVTAVAFSPDSATLASASEDRSIVIWDVASRKPLGEPLRSQGWVRGLAFSPDGKTLVTSGTDDGTVIIWDLATRTRIGALSGHTKAVVAIAFSPDGKRLASGGFDQSARLWDLDTRQPVGAPLAGHKDRITGVAFGEGLLATASADGTAILWDRATRKQLGRPLSVHDEPMTSIAFTRDGKWLATGDESGKAALWNVNVEYWRELACQISNRNLTCSEWKQFVARLPYAKLCEKLPHPPDLADCSEPSPSTAGR